MMRKTILSIALAMLYLSAKAEVLRCTIQEKEVYLANKEMVDSMLDFRYREEVARINHFFHVPEKDMAKTIVFARQFDRMDCGPACILRSLSHLTREGVSVTGIRDALSQIGADSASFEMTMEQLHDKCPHYRQYWFIEYDVVFTGRWDTLLKRQCIVIHNMSENEKVKKICYP